MPKEKEGTKYTSAVGRRKRSVARVRLFSGKGASRVGDAPLAKYFQGFSGERYLKPFAVAGVEGRYYVTAKIIGGGRSGQLQAFVHGVSRALAKVDPEKYRKPLKSAGLLTRDPREKERRKPGLAQSARAGKQSPKR